MELLKTVDVLELCQALNIRPTKKLGQNFVTDPGTIEKIVRIAGVQNGEHVLEIGPGLGSLSLGILAAGAALTAVEIDKKLAQALIPTVKVRDTNAQLRVVQRDAMELKNVEDLNAETGVSYLGETPVTDTVLSKPPVKLVANLPYNLAVPLVLQILQHFPSVQTALVMVQEEVADRMSAKPGNKIYGVPSLKIAWYGKAEKVAKIGTQVFYPQPNVASALVSIQRYENGQLGDESLRKTVFTLIDQAFLMRRKTLRQSLAKYFTTPTQAGQILLSAGIDPSRRGETLEITDFIAIAMKQKEANWQETGGQA